MKPEFSEALLLKENVFLKEQKNSNPCESILIDVYRAEDTLKNFVHCEAQQTNESQLKVLTHLVQQRRRLL